MAEEPPVALGIPGLGPATRIGSGGFADVYRAEQANLRRSVAVKVLRAPANDEQARMRFERECHAVGAVSGHPNIVGVHEGGFTTDGRAYLVMEFFPGGSLLDRLQSSGPMGAGETTEIGIKIARALSVAHDAGVLHRDVKPANILVSAYGEPALADFGIARVEGGQQTATGLVTASFAHASPEVLEGGAPSAASDVYSLGSTLYELFTGRAPHFRPDDESVWALMNRVVSTPVPDPTTVGMPDPLAAAVRKATARRPEDRQPTATDFVSHLSGGAGDGASLGGQPAPATALVDPVPTGLATPAVDPSTQLGATAALDTAAQARAVQDRAAAYEPTRVDYRPPVDSGAGGAPIHPSPPPGPERGRRGPILAALGLLVLAAAAAGWWLFLRSSEPALPPFEAVFAAGATGPLDAGDTYPLSVEGAGLEARYRLVVDGEPVGDLQADVPSYVAEAGRHSVAVEVVRGSTVEQSEAVEVYGIGDVPDPGYRANLVSVRANDSNWPAAVARFDELVAENHTDLELLPSDRFAGLTPGWWNLFVPGFGDDRGAAEDYCVSFDLEIPNECFVSFFDPTATP